MGSYFECSVYEVARYIVAESLGGGRIVNTHLIKCMYVHLDLRCSKFTSQRPFTKKSLYYLVIERNHVLLQEKNSF